jgi:hypothetical protein
MMKIVCEGEIIVSYEEIYINIYNNTFINKYNANLWSVISMGKDGGGA